MTSVVCNLRSGLLRRFRLYGGGFRYELHTTHPERGFHALQIDARQFEMLKLREQVEASGGWRTV